MILSNHFLNFSIQREPVDLHYHETETYSDGHPLMIKLRQIVDEALQREKVELEDRIQSAISEHVGTVHLIFKIFFQFNFLGQT